jgi:hypothetical protein
MPQEYLAAGATLTREQPDSLGYGLKTPCAVGAGQACTVYTSGRTGPHDLIGPVLQMMIRDGSDIESVTLLTREANVFGFVHFFQARKSWFAQHGVAA